MSLADYFANIQNSLRITRKILGIAKQSPKTVDLFLQSAATDLATTESRLIQLCQYQADIEIFLAQRDEYNQQLLMANYPPLQQADLYPCLYDKTSETGFDRHYIYHPAWAARILAKAQPEKHVDISSTLHFATILSAFIKVDFFDYRPAPLKLSNLASASENLTQLTFASNSIPSLSCMHVIEHIGLGRYGDPVDVDGDKKAARELARVLAKDGQLLVVVPVGAPRIQFNAHRIYSHQQVLALFPELTLVEYALIPDGVVPDGLIMNPDETLILAQSYGCGCYVFSK